GREIDRDARAIDDERDRRRGRDERFPLDVETEKRRRPDAALISDEPAEKSRERAADERRPVAAEPHPLRETGEAADAREHEQHSEHHRKGRALNDGLQSRAHEAADRARRPEPEKHLSVDPRSNEEETDERPGEVGSETIAIARRT